MDRVLNMLDEGWLVRMFKNADGSYTAKASNNRPEYEYRSAEYACAGTPTEALTRLAYKVHGEVI